MSSIVEVELVILPAVKWHKINSWDYLKWSRIHKELNVPREH